MYCSKCGTKNESAAKFCISCGTELAKGEGVTAGNVIAMPASIGRRLLNYFIDYALMYVLALVVGGILMLVEEDLAGLVMCLIFLGYHLFFESVFQRTPAKFMTGTKVVSLDGSKPSFLAILGRTIARIIPFEPFSFLFYGGHPAKGWHDRLSKTLVVPVSLTPEQVASIDINKKYEGKDSVGLVVIIIVGIFFGLMIIGILASVVLASLNTARAKGQDAAVKANISSARMQAEIYYDEHNDSYEGVCENPQVRSSLATLEGKECYDSEKAFAISAPLSTDGFYCADSTGYADVVPTALEGNVSCAGPSTLGTQDSVHARLVQMVAEDSWRLPEKLDSETEITNIFVSPDNVITYDYRLVNVVANETDWSSAASVIASQLREEYCSGESLAYFRNNDVTLEWRYFDMSQIILGSARMSAEDCD